MLFTKEEYKQRLRKVQESMQEKGIELMISQDTNNMNYLTGYDAWSFYYTQCVIVHANAEEPLCFVRAQDAGGAYIKTYSIFATTTAQSQFIRTNQLIKQGVVLTKSHFTITKEALFNKAVDMIFDINYIVDKQAAYTINEGSSIRPWMIKSIPIIKKEQIVNVMVKKDMVSLKIKAMAIEEGRVGDRIKMKLMPTNKIVLCRIVGENHVQVLY